MLESIQLCPEQDIPIYQQLVDVLLAQIKSGTLPPDTKLPTVRDLADQLQVARGTVKRAYDELERIGAICKMQGKGTFVRFQPATQGNRKERAMEAIDRLLDELEEMAFSMAEINIFLNLKLRQRAASQDELKVAVVECNPEILSQMMMQLHEAAPVELYPYLLREVQEYPYRIGEDVDLIVTTAEHAEELQDVISQREKLAKIALRLMPQSVAQILRLDEGSRVGILCRSERFGELIYQTCVTYNDQVETCRPKRFDDVEDMAVFLRAVDALVVPKGFEQYCEPEILQQIRDYGADSPLIQCLYQVDEGSMMYLVERIERMKERKKV